jgi:hypothetical protein
VSRQVTGTVRGQPLERLSTWSVDQDPACLEEQHAVAARERHGRPLLGDDDGAVELYGEIEERLSSLRVELRRRLVE